MKRAIRYAYEEATNRVIDWIPGGTQARRGYNIGKGLYELARPRKFRKLHHHPRPNRTRKSAAQRRRKRPQRQRGAGPPRLGKGPDHRTALAYHKLTQRQKNQLYANLAERKLVRSGYYERIADRRRSQRNKMPKRYARRRRGRRKRRSRPRYGTRPRARGRRRRRVAKTRLRLYPGGVPQTHIVKLRVMRQYVITTPTLEWGFIEFNPASMRIPFPGSKAAGTVNSHKNLKMATVTDTFSTNRQPYGYDHWLLGDASKSHYKDYKVLGSKITIKFIPSARTADAGDNYYAGWSQLFTGPAGNASSTDGPTLDSKYGNVAASEIGDWMNAGIVKRRRVVTTGGDGRFKSFVFKYSAKRWERQLKRNGIQYGVATPDSGLLWQGNHGTDPVINPVCYFMMADIGTSDVGQAINVMITIEYTVKLSSLDLVNASLG